MRTKFWAFMLYAVGLMGMVGVIAGCGGMPENAAAVVNGKVITGDDVANRIEQLRKVYGAMIPTEEDGDAYTDFRREVADQLVREELEKEETDRRSITVSNEELQARFTEMAEESYLGDIEALKKDYADKGMTEEEMIDDVRRTLLHEKLLADVGKDISVTDEDARQYYERNLSQYVQPERRQARQLITDSEAAAVDAVKRARAGESFLTVVDQVSIDDSVKERKGALGLVSPGQLAPELDKVLFSMSIGQISDPIRLGEQWYVLSLESILPPVNTSFEEKKAEIIVIYSNQIFSERYRALVQEVYDSADISFDPEYDPAFKTKKES